MDEDKDKGDSKTKLREIRADENISLNKECFLSYGEIVLDSKTLVVL